MLADEGHPHPMGDIQFSLIPIYPLVNVYTAMERSTIFNGKINYKWPFSIAMLNYQMVAIDPIV